MKRDELFEHHKELTTKALKLMEVKNNDYAGSSGNTPFANFERCEAMGVCPTSVGFMVRIVDKVSRLSTFTADGKLLVSNEGYEDAIIDIINYCILFSAYTKSKQPKPIETLGPTKYPYNYFDHLDDEDINPPTDNCPSKKDTTTIIHTGPLTGNITIPTPPGPSIWDLRYPNPHSFLGTPCNISSVTTSNV